MPPKRKSSSELDPNKEQPLQPDVYTPLERQEYDAESLLLPQPTSPMECFSYFFNLEIWEVLCNGTNSYHTSKYTTAGSSERGWRPVTVRDMKIWIGLVIYMGIVDCPSIKDYWAEDTRQKPMDAMGLNRFEQIKRYIHISLPITASAPPAPPAPPALPAPPAPPPAWYKKLEPMASMLANRFRSAYMPSSNCSIDEMMVRFTGRSKHTLKMPNKPIDEGYKVFAICDHGYTYGFEFCSRVDGASGLIGHSPIPPPIPPPIGYSRNLTPTSTTCLRLALLLPYRKWHYSIYFDSFFSNTALFATLQELGIGACGTARKDQIPVELQQYDSANSKIAEWGDLASVLEDNVQCARWQDNAGVFMMTTIHDVNDCVVANRKRPKKKGNPAACEVSGTTVRKLLTIPLMINDFNYHMGGVDIADQLRSYYYTQLPSSRSWLPLFYWLLDTTIVNSYILFRMYNPLASHKKFRLELAKALWSSVDSGGDHIHILVREEAQRSCKAIGCTTRTRFICTYCRYPYCILCS